MLSGRCHNREYAWARNEAAGSQSSGARVVYDAERIGRLISAANLNGCERVLDVATGPGYIAEAFARMAAEVVGVDLTEAMLRIARERVQSRGLKNVSFRLGDAKSLPYGEGEFDVVVTRFSLH